MWTEIDTDDALELLGPGTVDSRVRAFAVKQLSRADDDVRVLFAFNSLIPRKCCRFTDDDDLWHRNSRFICCNSSSR
jgi:hypothetical protein